MDSWSNARALEDKAAELRQALNQPRTAINLREINRLKVELQETEELIRRDLKSRGLFTQLSLAVNPQSVQTSSIRRPPKAKFSEHEANYYNQNSLPDAASLFTHAEEEEHQQQQQQQQEIQKPTDNEVSRFIRDLTLPRPAIIDKRTIVFTDVCRCGAEMHRQPTMSFLICPVCSFKRIRVDMCPADVAKTTFERAKGPGSGVSKTGSKGGAAGNRHAPKTASHYGGFLSRKPGRVDPARLEELCKFAYVEGARSHTDITHQLINLAQKHTARGVEYQMTRVYVSLLRNDRMVIPNAIKKDMVKLYLFMHPVYSKHKHDEVKKSNMAKFSFVSRILCRLRGYDVLLPLFDNFAMPPIVIRRTSFMRRVFKKLGWEWCDEISDVKAKDLDAFDAANGITDITDEDMNGGGDDSDDDEEGGEEEKEGSEEKEAEKDQEQEQKQAQEQEQEQEQEKKKPKRQARKRTVTDCEESEAPPAKRSRKKVAAAADDDDDDLSPPDDLFVQ